MRSGVAAGSPWPTASGSNQIPRSWAPVLRHGPCRRGRARRDPPYTRSGFFVDAAPAERSQLVAEGLRTLARVHETDIDDPGLAMLRTPGVRHGSERQLEVWEADLREGLAGRSSLLFDECLSWLHDQLPPPATAGALVGRLPAGQHDLAGLRGGLHHRFRGSGPRPPGAGCGLVAHVRPLDARRFGHRPGWPENRTGRSNWTIYEEAAGTSIGGTTWYEVFSALRFATTVVQVMNRWVARERCPTDQTVWRDNPATAVLADLFEEVTTMTRGGSLAGNQAARRRRLLRVGRAIGLAAAAAGASVAFAARRLELLKTAVDEAGTSSLAIVCDVTDPSSVVEMVEGVVKVLGGLDAVVYATGSTLSSG